MGMGQREERIKKERKMRQSKNEKACRSDTELACSAWDLAFSGLIYETQIIQPSLYTARSGGITRLKTLSTELWKQLKATHTNKGAFITGPGHLKHMGWL